MNIRRLSGFGLAFVLVVGLFAAMAPAASAQSDPPGNNGTVKIHEGADEPSPEMRNMPHVCTFHVHAFNFDADQALTYAIYEWAPTAPVKGTEVTSGTITANADGEGRTPGAISLPDGHYRLVVDTGNGDHTQDKHKMFWVDCPTERSETGQLVVTKHWVDEDATTTPTFHFTYDCGATTGTLSTDSDFDVDGTTATAVVQNLQPGDCTVAEVTTEGWDWDTTVNGDEGTSATVHVSAGHEATVAFVNTRRSTTTPETGSLVVTKAWEDEAATTTPTFAFTYDCGATTGTLSFPDDFDVDGQAGTTTAVSSLAAGTTCTVSETGVDSTYWDTTVNGEDATSATVTIAAGQATTVAFRNVHATAIIPGGGEETGGNEVVLPTATETPNVPQPAVVETAPPVAVAGVVYEKASTAAAPGPTAAAPAAVLGTSLARTGSPSGALAALGGLLLLGGAGLVLAGRDRRTSTS